MIGLFCLIFAGISLFVWAGSSIVLAGGGLNDHAISRCLISGWLSLAAFAVFGAIALIMLMNDLVAFVKHVLWSGS